MDCRNYIESLMINYGLGLSSGYYYYSKKEFYKPNEYVKSVSLKGEEVKLIILHDNQENLEKDISSAKDAFVLRSKQVKSNINDSSVPQKLVDVLQQYIGETFRYYGSIIEEPTMEALNLMVSLADRTVKNYADKISNAYNVHDLKMNQVMNEIQQEKNDANMKLMMDEMNKPVQLRAESKGYESFSGRPIVETKYYTEGNTWQEKAKLREKMSSIESNAYVKGVLGRSDANSALDSSINTIIEKTGSEFSKILKDIISTKHSNLFEQTDKTYSDMQYWEENIEKYSVEDIDSIREIFDFYGYNFDKFINGTFLSNFVKHVLSFPEEYKGTLMDMYLHINNIDSFNIDDYPDIKHEIETKYYSMYERKSSLEEKEKEKIISNYYLNDEDKSRIISNIEKNCEKFVKEEEQRWIQREEENIKFKKQIKRHERTNIIKGISALLVLFLIGSLLIYVHIKYGKDIRDFLSIGKGGETIIIWICLLASPLIIGGIVILGSTIWEWLNDEVFYYMSSNSIGLRIFIIIVSLIVCIILWIFVPNLLRLFKLV